MRRTERLFQIVQRLRDARTLTACALATSFDVSERTIYRDIQVLSLSGIPILSQPGVGYSLLPGFQLPPLTFSPEELEALLLGMRMVRAWTDPGLANAALNAIERIEAVLPDKLKIELTRDTLLVPQARQEHLSATTLSNMRTAIRNQQTLLFDYTRGDGTHSRRRVNPLGLFYWGRNWTLIAWCELRADFRQFRLDRITEIQFDHKRFNSKPGQTLQDYLAHIEMNAKPGIALQNASTRLGESL